MTRTEAVALTFFIFVVGLLIAVAMYQYQHASELQRLCFTGCGSRGVVEFNESGHGSNKTNCVCGPAPAGSGP